MNDIILRIRLPSSLADRLKQIQAGLVEIAIGVDPLRQKLKIDAGQTLAGLGLFTDEKRLQ